jgi:hypothetical protein
LTFLSLVVFFLCFVFFWCCCREKIHQVCKRTSPVMWFSVNEEDNHRNLKKCMNLSKSWCLMVLDWTLCNMEKRRKRLHFSLRNISFSLSNRTIFRNLCSTQ